MNVHAVYALNDMYFYGVAASVNSVCRNASAENTYNIYLLYSKLSEEHMTIEYPHAENIKVQYIHVDLSEFDSHSSLYSYDYLTEEMYFRLFIPEIINEKKILYLDSDTVVDCDIAKLYSEDLTGFVMGAVYDFPTKNRACQLTEIGIDPNLYFNSGVLLINADEYMKHDISGKCLALLDTHKEYICPDQDALNVACSGKVKLLGDCWNFQWGHIIYNAVGDLRTPEEISRYLRQKQEFAIIHYTSANKPWKVYANTSLIHYYFRAIINTAYFAQVIGKLDLQENNPLVIRVEENACAVALAQCNEGRTGIKYILKMLKGWIKYKFKRK